MKEESWDLYQHGATLYFHSILRDAEAEFLLNYLDLPLIASIRKVHSKLEIITSNIAE